MLTLMLMIICQEKGSYQIFAFQYRTYDALRKEHDAQIVQIATEAGLRILPDQWSSLLYGDLDHKSHMQSIIDKVQYLTSWDQNNICSTHNTLSIVYMACSNTSKCSCTSIYLCEALLYLRSLIINCSQRFQTPVLFVLTLHRGIISYYVRSSITILFCCSSNLLPHFLRVFRN